MIKIQAFIVAFALLILGYTVTITDGDRQPEGYYLTVGERGIAEIIYAAPGSSGGCVHADGSLFRKGEQVWLEGIDQNRWQSGVKVSALDESGAVVWSATLGGSHYKPVWNDWNVFYEEG